MSKVWMLNLLFINKTYFQMQKKINFLIIEFKIKWFQAQIPTSIHKLMQINEYVGVLCCYYAEQIQVYPKRQRMITTWSKLSNTQ